MLVFAEQKVTVVDITLDDAHFAGSANALGAGTRYVDACVEQCIENGGGGADVHSLTSAFEDNVEGGLGSVCNRSRWCGESFGAQR